MRRMILAVFILALVTGAPPALTDQADVHFTQPAVERVLIRNGFTVPTGSRLLIDDMSVDCVIASEIFDPEEFPKVGVEATAYLRIVYPPDACPEEVNLMGGATVRHRITWSAPERRAG